MTLFTLSGITILAALALAVFYDLHGVSYDDNYLYVSRFRKERQIDLKNVRTIKGTDLFELNPFFQIELSPAKGRVETISFLPPILEHMEYTFTRTLKGSALTFKKKLSDPTANTVYAP